MNLGEFHARVKTVLARGSSLDTEIPLWVEEAVQEIELNKTFQYMKRWREFSVDASSDSPHVISLYGIKIKEIKLIRYLRDSDDRFVDLKQINPQDRATREAGMPSGYWLNGVNSLILDSIPDEDLSLEAHFDEYSTWLPEQEDLEHYLIDRHRSLLLSQTVLVANVTLRDARLGALYSQINLQAWTLANNGEEPLQNGGEEENQMIWTPEHDEFDPNFYRNRSRD